MLFTAVLTLALVASATAYSSGIQDVPQNLMKMAMSHCKRGFVPLHGKGCPGNTASACPLDEPWSQAYMPQRSQNPYRLEFKPATLTTYTPGVPITVELVGTATDKIKGFFAYADVQNVFLQANNQFQATGDAKPTSYCSTKGVTHTNGRVLKDRVSFTVIPDARIDQGQLQIVATVVKNFETFYLDVRSKTLSINNPANKPNPTKFMQTQFNQGGLADMMQKMMQNLGAAGAGRGGGQSGGARPPFQMPQMPQQPMGGFNMQSLFQG